MAEQSFLLNWADDVVSFSSNSYTYKFGKFRDALKNIFQEKGQVLNVVRNQLETQLRMPSHGWFNEGFDCEVLNFGDKKWQKGKLKIKVSLEFYPDEPVGQTTASNQPESPLVIVLGRSISKL